MVHLVSGETAVDAWKAGSELLLHTPGGEVFNLITEIRSPCIIRDDWWSRYSPKAVNEKDSLSVVAKVLFPGLARRPDESRAQYFARSADLLRRGRSIGSLSRPSWGSTYFERLCSLDGSENQIERAINVLNNWSTRPKAAIVMHLSSPKSDRIMKMGAPCLQFIEIMSRSGNVLDLMAVYRNHDFLAKALGNFIGLGRLLAFISAETNQTCGRIICHSAHATVGRRKKLQELVDR